ncbi:glycosyltransferase [Sphingobacterium sp. DN00404]|uniref:Glycosyltransferase n=1 Tax=Sphingobacterium micropteri TaxID=2763501 RepID=A0ABR7YQM8_9SPHI|nr:glycosyltransferase family 2 protein [Sphingobacterium micropteri]MBD1433483.1 glycosyltransferase [Sphingobacterium micropteri]
MNKLLPKVSIITVVYNDVHGIEHTIRSVMKQTYVELEYIIIDGLSTDGTLAVIDRYREEVSIVISEKDQGIYDAMNKGLSVATGEYVLFLNSGDELYEDMTLEKVFSSAENADIYYGETKLIDAERNIIGDRRHKTPKHFDWKSFRYGMNICHQAIYVKRSIAAPYDLQYELSADIDWVIRAAKKANKIVNVNQYVAKYLVGGTTQKRHRQSLKERYAIFKKYYGTFANVVNHGVIAARLILYRLKHGKTRE